MTRYYKNLSEDLQRQINHLIVQLSEVAGTMQAGPALSSSGPGDDPNTRHIAGTMDFSGPKGESQSAIPWKAFSRAATNAINAQYNTVPSWMPEEYQNAYGLKLWQSILSEILNALQNWNTIASNGHTGQQIYMYHQTVGLGAKFGVQVPWPFPTYTPGSF